MLWEMDWKAENLPSAKNFTTTKVKSVMKKYWDEEEQNNTKKITTTAPPLGPAPCVGQVSYVQLILSHDQQSAIIQAVNKEGHYLRICKVALQQ